MPETQLEKFENYPNDFLQAVLKDLGFNDRSTYTFCDCGIQRVAWSLEFGLYNYLLNWSNVNLYPICIDQAIREGLLHTIFNLFKSNHKKNYKTAITNSIPFLAEWADSLGVAYWYFQDPEWNNLDNELKPLPKFKKKLKYCKNCFSELFEPIYYDSLCRQKMGGSNCKGKYDGDFKEFSRKIGTLESRLTRLTCNIKNGEKSEREHWLNSAKSEVKESQFIIDEIAETLYSRLNGRWFLTKKEFDPYVDEDKVKIRPPITSKRGRSKLDQLLTKKLLAGENVYDYVSSMPYVTRVDARIRLRYIKELYHK